ncbi:hypothetical protein Q3G72_013596 [Acer saccharum]|nr:hypothetical protein Q3G72_013596 [Acer saccharum]
MLSKSLFIISIGSNDILDHYRLNSTRSKQELITDRRSAYRNHLQIKALLQRLSSKSKGMKYSLGNAYDMSMKIIDNPRDSGFENIVQRACCGNGMLNGEYPCLRFTRPQLCSNQRK